MDSKNELIFDNIYQDTSNLTQSDDTIRKQNKELTRYSSRVAHDLQAPLRSLKFYHSILRSHFGSKIDKEVLEYIDDADALVNSMSLLIENLLKNTLHEEESNFSEVIYTKQLIEGVVQDYKAAFTKTRAKIEIINAPKISGNTILIRQLFSNLIGNALKYCKNKPVITIDSRETDSHWLFLVRDNGIGIGADNLLRIFKPFVRIHHRREYEGRGLGLDFCRKIVLSHGGDIWVESELNIGSVFHFKLSKNSFCDEYTK